MRHLPAFLLLAVVAECTVFPLAATASPSPDEDRINLWPVMYKRGGQLSILGPVFSISDENFSFRPFFAVNSESGKRIRVLYPLSEFNPGSGPNWIGPYLWGPGYNMLIPAWSHRKEGENHSFWVLWPLIRKKEWNDTRIWWAGPIVGTLSDLDRTAPPVSVSSGGSIAKSKRPTAVPSSISCSFP
jgi:hypothetical protein